MTWHKRFNALTQTMKTLPRRLRSTPTAGIASGVATASRVKRWLRRVLTPTPIPRGEINDPKLDRLWRTYAGIPTPSQWDRLETGWTSSTAEASHTEPSKTIASATTELSSLSRSGGNVNSLGSSTAGTTLLQNLTDQSTEHHEGSQYKPSLPDSQQSRFSFQKARWMVHYSDSTATTYSELRVAQEQYRRLCEKQSLTVEEFDSMFAQIWTNLGTMQLKDSQNTSPTSSE